MEIVRTALQDSMVPCVMTDVTITVKMVYVTKKLGYALEDAHQVVLASTVITLALDTVLVAFVTEQLGTVTMTVEPVTMGTAVTCSAILIASKTGVI